MKMKTALNEWPDEAFVPRDHQPPEPVVDGLRKTTPLAFRLDKVGPGDLIALTNRRSTTFYRVDRTTKTQIIVGRNRYRRSDGKQAGSTTRRAATATAGIVFRTLDRTWKQWSETKEKQAAAYSRQAAVDAALAAGLRPIDLLEQVDLIDPWKSRDEKDGVISDEFEAAVEQYEANRDMARTAASIISRVETAVRDHNRYNSGARALARIAEEAATAAAEVAEHVGAVEQLQARIQRRARAGEKMAKVVARPFSIEAAKAASARYEAARGE